MKEHQKYIDFINEWKSLVNYNLPLTENDMDEWLNAIMNKYSTNDFLYVRELLLNVIKKNHSGNIIEGIKFEFIEAFNSLDMGTFFCSSRKLFRHQLLKYKELIKVDNKYTDVHNIVLCKNTLLNGVVKIALHAINKIKEEYFDIKIEIIEKDPLRQKQIIDKYEEVKTLYLKGEYESAIQKARDIFQKDLEDNLNGDMQMFQNSSDLIETEFNTILNSITKIRNKCKTEKYSKNLQPIAKVIIEQLLSIRNFIALNKEKEGETE